MPDRRGRRRRGTLHGMHAAMKNSPQGMQRESPPRLGAPALNAGFSKQLEQAGQRFTNVMAFDRSAASQIPHDPAASALNHLLAALNGRLAAELTQSIRLSDQPLQLGIGPEP